MLWLRNRLPNLSGGLRLAIAIHSLASGLFLPFLVVYVVQADYLSPVAAGVALLVGLIAVRLVVGPRKLSTGTFRECQSCRD